MMEDEEEDGGDGEDVEEVDEDDDFMDGTDVPLMTPIRSNPRQRQHQDTPPPPDYGKTRFSTKRSRSPPSSNGSSNGSPRRSAEITEFDGSFASNGSSAAVSDGYVSSHHHGHYASPG